MPTPNQQLQALYDELPTIDCKGKCWRSCSASIPCTPMEMRIAMGPFRVEPPKPQGEFCPYLDLETKRCTIHPRRPLICRLYGISEGLPCPFGCKPTPRYLTNDEARHYTLESIRISEGHA